MINVFNTGGSSIRKVNHSPEKPRESWCLRENSTKLVVTKTMNTNSWYCLGTSVLLGDTWV